MIGSFSNEVVSATCLEPFVDQWFGKNNWGTETLMEQPDSVE
jgi:hypothetical protein